MEYSLHAGFFATMVDPEIERRSACCPLCRERALVPILYGPLPDSLTEDRERGAFLWGGWMMRRDSPRWKCRACGESFASKDGG